MDDTLVLQMIDADLAAFEARSRRLDGEGRARAAIDLRRGAKNLATRTDAYRLLAEAGAATRADLAEIIVTALLFRADLLFIADVGIDATGVWALVEEARQLHRVLDEIPSADRPYLLRPSGAVLAAARSRATGGAER